MKLTQLKKLIKNGESELLEFKNSTASIGSGMQTLCAFLNSERGGVVVFGVKDDGRITGQEVTDKTRKEIAVELNKFEPHTHLDVQYVSVADNRFAIVISALPGEKQPYRYDGRPFMRNQSTTMRMNDEVYLYLFNKSRPTLWESRTDSTCTIEDLDEARIKKVIRRAIHEKRLPEEAQEDSIPVVLEKFDLIRDNKLTNAAVILFCKNERKQFIQSTIKIARFRGTTKTVFIKQEMIRANAFDIYDKAMAFLDFALPVGAHIEPGRKERVETPAIPYSVLRETLTNALVHRDYSHPGIFLDVAMYDDRVEVTNPGSLLTGVTVNELTRTHKSVLRNPLIANVFYVCGLIEGWGRGTLDMIRDCKDAGNPPPKFAKIGGGFSVTLFLREPVVTIIEKPKPLELHELTTRQKKILAILEQGPLSRAEIKEKLDIQLNDRVMQKDLARLRELGLAKSSGKTKSMIWRKEK